jgi:hypothetical protein
VKVTGKIPLEPKDLAGDGMVLPERDLSEALFEPPPNFLPVTLEI